LSDRIRHNTTFLPLLLLAVWVLYLVNDFAFRHGHITPDGRYFSHVHYSKDKDSKHSHSEDEYILLDILSNPTYLDVEISEFLLKENLLTSFIECASHYIFRYSNQLPINNPHRGPPAFA